MHYVYVLATVESGRHRAPSKIGVSSNPWARLQSIQTSCPHELAIAFTFKVEDLAQARIVERLALENWGRYRLKGEWVDVLPAYAVNMVATCVEFVRCRGVPLFSQAYQVALDRFGITDALVYCEREVPGFISEPGHL